MNKFCIHSIRLLLIILGLLPYYVSSSQKTDPNIPMKHDVYRAKQDAIEYLSDSLVLKQYGNISDAIWNYAELGMQEFKSSALLIKTLEDEGFKIEKGVSGMPTCFVATWGSGKPVIGILGEFDALPGLSQKANSTEKMAIVTGAPGHGCGHNLMGTAGTAAAIAVKKSMMKNDIGGTIKFFGSPAEETLISRAYMVRDGVFNDVDAVIDNHASSGLSTSYGVSGNAVISVVFSFKGKSSHAASAPWLGISALDGVELMNVAVNYLREHLFYTARLHYTIKEGGEAPNVVPDRASVWYYVRNSDDRIEETFERVLDCAKGAAIASGATLDTVTVLTAIHQRHSNKGIAETIQRNIELIGMPEWTEQEQLFARALQRELGEKETGYTSEIKPLKDPATSELEGSSTDVGEVTMVAPTATLNFPGEVPGSIGHHWSLVTCNYGPTAWKGLNTGAKIMAATALDLLTKPDVLEGIKSEFLKQSRDHPYKSLLPEGTKPPLYLNGDLMNKYRDQMTEALNDDK
jgi:aminobenzoyl-glutamate utilization protein B